MVPKSYGQEVAPPDGPTFSIVTPALNAEDYIRQTLRTVVAQEHPSLEHIVMDGGSEDATNEIVAEFSDHIAHSQSGPDGGPARAINAGFERSNGEIMGWLNADDILLPGTLAYVSRFFATHPEVDMVYGHRVILDELDREIGIWVTPPHCEDTLRWFDYLPQETAFWRRRLWDEHGGLDERFRLAYDWELFSRYQVAGARIVRLPRFLGGFRSHLAQRTQAHWDAAAEELATIRAIWHGREVSVDEAKARVDLYRFRSVPGYVRHRLAAKRSWGRVPAVPPEIASPSSG